MKKFLTILIVLIGFVGVSALLYNAARQDSAVEVTIYPDISDSILDTELMVPIKIDENKPIVIEENAFGNQIRIEYGEYKELPDGTKVSIDRTINEPCEEVCVWSGQAIWYKWLIKNGEEIITPPYDDFGYSIETIETDYEKYAVVVIEKNDLLSPQPKSTQVFEKGMRYLGDSKEKCAVIRYFCYEGEESFSDEDGCGCRLIETDE